jgi:hypothetical protein
VAILAADAKTADVMFMAEGDGLNNRDVRVIAIRGAHVGCAKRKDTGKDENTAKDTDFCDGIGRGMEQLPSGSSADWFGGLIL